jgi:hypothetical protein
MEAAGPLLAEGQGAEQIGMGLHLAGYLVAESAKLRLRGGHGGAFAGDLTAQTAWQVIQRITRDHHNQNRQYHGGNSQLRTTHKFLTSGAGNLPGAPLHYPRLPR